LLLFVVCLFCFICHQIKILGFDLCFLLCLATTIPCILKKRGFPLVKLKETNDRINNYKFGIESALQILLFI